MSYPGISTISPNAIMPINQNSKLVSASFTRPANTTAYSINQVVADSTSAATILSFNVGRINGASGYIVKARLETNSSSDTSSYRLHLFHTAPTMLNDAANFTLLYVNKDKRIGAIDFDPLITGGTGSDASRSQNTSPLFYNTAANSTTIYGILEILSTRTPVSSQQFFIELAVEQN